MGVWLRGHLGRWLKNIRFPKNRPIDNLLKVDRPIVDINYLYIIIIGMAFTSSHSLGEHLYMY